MISEITLRLDASGVGHTGNKFPNGLNKLGMEAAVVISGVGWVRGLGKIALLGIVTVSAQAVAVDSVALTNSPAADVQQQELLDWMGQEGNLNTTRIQQELLSLVNAEREQVGADPLVMNEQLNQAARREAIDIARQRRLSHVGSDGSTVRTRIEDTGYLWSAIGENIAMGQTSPEAVMAAWMRSEGHRQNILNPEFSELGLANVEAEGYKYWVQVFASPR